MCSSVAAVNVCGTVVSPQSSISLGHDVATKVHIQSSSRIRPWRYDWVLLAPYSADAAAVAAQSSRGSALWGLFSAAADASMAARAAAPWAMAASTQRTSRSSSFRSSPFKGSILKRTPVLLYACLLQNEHCIEADRMPPLWVQFRLETRARRPPARLHALLPLLCWFRYS